MNISRVALVLASAAVLATLTSCGSSDTVASPVTSTRTTATMTQQSTLPAPASISPSAVAVAPQQTPKATADGPPPPAPAVPVTAACSPASDRLLAAVTGAFKEKATTLLNAVVVQGPNDLQYIGAELVVGGKAAGVDGIWVAKGDTVYALSDEARSRTTLDDGAAVQASAGDEFGQKVQNCLTAGLPVLGLGSN